MLTKTLTSTFKDINTEDVHKWLDNNRPYRHELFSPELTFSDDFHHLEGCYDFEVDGLKFLNAWVTPYARDENGTVMYRCGSYYVIKE